MFSLLNVPDEALPNVQDILCIADTPYKIKNIKFTFSDKTFQIFFELCEF